MSGGDYYNCSRKAYHILRRKIQRAVSIRVQRIAIENEARALISQADLKESTRPCAMTIDADDVSDNNCVQDELEHVPSLMDEGDVSNEDDIDDDCSSDVSSSADVTTSCSDDDEYNYTDSDDRSDDGKSSDQCDEASLKQDMLAWYMKFNVKQDALTALLHILREHGVAGLPLDARTLVGTPQNITLQQIAGGEYHYFGIADTLRHVLSSHTLSQGQVLQLQINMDGLPVYKSVKSDLWPILGLLFHKGSVFISEPFCIGVYYGPSKPTSAHDYVRQFVEEFNLLHDQGLEVNGVTVRLQFHSAICDCPAKAFAKSIVPFNAYYGCDQCETKGKYSKSARRMSFPNIDATPRTDESFAKKTNRQHHKLTSLFTMLAGILMITHWPVDYMHCLLLGVMRKLLHMWTKGRKATLKHKLHDDMISEMTSIMLKCADTCPSEFGRRPRSLNDLDRFKATEFRTFLCYVGMLVTKGYLSSKKYCNFLLLVCATRIMLTADPGEEQLEVARNCVRAFVKHFRRVYGYSHIVYNVHALSHLPKCAKNFKGLDNISSFPFENYLHKLKCMIRKPGATLQQVVRRITERRHSSLPKKPTKNVIKHYKQHYEGPLPPEYNIDAGVKQYKTIVAAGIRFSTDRRDSIIKSSSDLCKIVNIISVNGQYLFVIQRFHGISDFFTYPVRSRLVGVHKVSDSTPSGRLHVRSLKNVQKCWLLPHKKGGIIVELTNVTY